MVVCSLAGVDLDVDSVLVKLGVLRDRFFSLIDWFRSLDGGVMVMFSGGVDSSVVLSTAVAVLGVDRVVATTVLMQVTIEEDVWWAKEIVRMLGVKNVVIDLDILSDTGFVSNSVDRCYICKKRMLERVKRLAEDLGVDTVVDGSNVSDLHTWRPGVTALKEFGVRSPLAEVGLSKEEVRAIARAFNLPNWWRPPSSCLATRIPYGTPITLEKLVRIATAEKIVRELAGATLVRVRDHGDIARIEVDRNERKKFFNEEVMDRVAEELKKLGYRYVTLDVMGYRSGSLDESL